MRLTNAKAAVWTWLDEFWRNWRTHCKLERSVILFEDGFKTRKTKTLMMHMIFKHLRRVARHWNALIFVNEADVYMKRRCKQNVARKKLVSMFLRKLKYCENIIFLTTNRVFDFDEAILSRIYFMLKYDELNIDVKSQIWEHFLYKTRTFQEETIITRKKMNRLIIINFSNW